MNRRLAFALAPVLAAGAAACSTPDPLYCDEDTPCSDPELSFCDDDGIYPASEGIKHTCIAEPSFAITLSDDDAQVRIGGELALEVTIDRIDDFPGDITVTAADLPAGATADPLTISDGATTGTLTIQAPDAEPGALAAATVTATAAPFERAADLNLLVLGPAGSLDPTFGVNGLAGEPAASSTDDARLLMQLANGGFIVGGGRKAGVPTAHLVRYSAEGALETDFGDGGVAEVDFEGTEVDAQGNVYLASQSGDRVVLGMGSASGDIVLVRVTGDAERDNEFGGNGIIASGVSGGYVQVAGLVVGASDEFVVGLHVGTGRDLIYLVRFTEDGERDQAFATDGRLEIDRGDSHLLSGVHVFDDGSLLVTGSALDGGGTSVPFALRYTPTGSLDTGFGDGGELVLDPTWGISTILPDAQGRWLVGGHIDGKPAVFRLTETGEVDTSFGKDGAVIVPVPEGRTGSIRLLLSGEDDIIAVGSPDVLMTRLEEDEIDPSFGSDGVAIFQLEDLFAVNAVRRTDGRVVVLADNDSLSFVLGRFFD